MTKLAQKESADTRLRYGVSVGEPAQNKLFDEVQHAITRFLTFIKPVKCAHCGKMKKKHWTQLVFFRVAEPTGFTLEPSAAQYPPLTPVCTDHILKPDFE
jgi:hypothetical protein